jgi:tRNA pseudouridine55 synthase
MLPPNKPGQLNGLLILDKPRGISSMAAVAEVRRRAGGARTGHAGTLDPLATGVLIVAIGPATKRLSEFMAMDKRYQTTIDLRAFTTTDDLEGEREEVAAEPPGAQNVREALRQFTGPIMQRPPAFSAMKVGGKRAYKLARRGAPPVMAPRPVVIHAIELLEYRWPMLTLDVRCEKGVYIRSLARDIGVALGTGGHCASLRRTAIGRFTEAQAIAVSDLPRDITQADLLAI